MTTRAHLSLVADRPRPGQRIVGPPAPRTTNRPGDRRDPVPFEVGPEAVELARAAADRGLDFDQAACLLVERALVLDDAASLGLSEGEALSPLRAAAERPDRVALPPSLARYARSLIDRRPLTSGERTVEGPRYVALPVRLTARVTRLDLAAVLVAEHLDEAIRLEAAAASSGRTLSEWALLKLAERG